jgi:hypothetical protein
MVGKGKKDTLIHSELYVDHPYALQENNTCSDQPSGWSTNKLIIDWVERDCDVPCQLRTDSIFLLQVIDTQAAKGYLNRRTDIVKINESLGNECRDMHILGNIACLSADGWRGCSGTGIGIDRYAVSSFGRKQTTE